MTTVEFRRNSVYTTAIRSVLNDPYFQLALEVLKDSNPVMDADPHDPEIVSVRLLSQMTGYGEYPKQLKLLAEPLQEPVELKAEFKPEEE